MVARTVAAPVDDPVAYKDHEFDSEYILCGCTTRKVVDPLNPFNPPKASNAMKFSAIAAALTALTVQQVAEAAPSNAPRQERSVCARLNEVVSQNAQQNSRGCCTFTTLVLRC